MNAPGDFKSQLAELTTRLAVMVAERIAWWSRNMDPGDRQNILNMIEGQLPDIIANTVAKSPSLHSAGGVEYFEQNLESMADTYAKKFIGKI
jgi:hypothetical protein